MQGQRQLTFYHAPDPRSSGVLALLAEIVADCELRVLNLRAIHLRPAMTRARARDAELAAAQV